MSQDGYWQPIVRCKTPDCADGNPIYLPHPDLPETTEPQPNWPAENWHPLLVCKFCGRGYHYHAKDVEWISTHFYSGLPQNDLMLLVELHCRARQRACILTIANPSPCVRRLMALTHLESVLQVAGSAATGSAENDDDECERRAMSA